MRTMGETTFEQLPEEKRNRILAVCYKEFSLHHYRTASVSRIVEQADIAKGSMYQYFDNKMALYVYLLERAGTEKLDYLRERVDIGSDFFSLLKDVVLKGAQFNLENPHKSSMLYNALRETERGELRDIAVQLAGRSIDFFKEMLESAVSNGTVRESIGPDFTAFVLHQISIGLEDYLERSFGFSFEEVLREEEPVIPVEQEQLESIIDEFVRFVRRGIGAGPAE